LKIEGGDNGYIILNAQTLSEDAIGILGPYKKHSDILAAIEKTHLPKMKPYELFY